MHRKEKVNRTEFKILRQLLIICIIILPFMGMVGCEESNKIKEVSLETLNVLDTEGPSQKKKTLRVAIGSITTSSEGSAYYKELMDYVGKKIGKYIKLIDTDNYAQVNSLLKSGDIDAAFVCGRPYVDGHDEFGLELLVAPQVNGKTEYYSYIIVNIDSPVTTFDELRGKTFAFADPRSNTGKLVPTYMLAKMNETPDSFFDKYIFTYAHNKSIKAVGDKLVDGAAVDSLIWDYYNKTKPEVTSKTKIILKSLPYGIPPFVVSSGIDPETKNKLRDIFLSLHKDEKSKKVLKKMMIDKFVLVDDSQYGSIRKMIGLLGQ